MESKKGLNIDLIWIDDTEHARGIVTMNASLFHETTVSIREDDSESGDSI